MATPTITKISRNNIQCQRGEVSLEIMARFFRRDENVVIVADLPNDRSYRDRDSRGADHESAISAERTAKGEITRKMCVCIIAVVL